MDFRIVFPLTPWPQRGLQLTGPKSNVKQRCVNVPFPLPPGWPAALEV